jgi:catechol 2,3-dioxygenase-like lactoylglutathione lyase family enzyme
MLADARCEMVFNEGSAMETATTSVAIAGSFYFGLVTARFYETWDFYTERLGFRTLDEDDHRVLLGHPSGVRLGILRHETDEQHAELVSATDGRGFWLNLDVADVDAMYQSLSEVNVLGVQPLAAGPRGARFFTVHDPNGVLIRIARAQPVASAWGEELEIAKNAAS